MLKKRSWISIIILLVILVGTLFIIKKERDLHRLVEAKLTDLVNQDILAATGAQIEELKFDFRLKNLFRGYLSQLKISIKNQKIRATFNGPLRFSILGWGKRHVISYKPKVIFEDIAAGSPSTPFDLSLRATLSKNFLELQKLVTSLEAQTFSWKSRGINLEGIKLDLSLIPAKNIFKFNLVSKSASYESDDNSLLLGLQNIAIRVRSPLNGTYNFTFASQNAEILSGNNYYDIPLTDISLYGEVSPEESRANVFLQAKKLAWNSHLVIDKSQFSLVGDFKKLNLFLPWLANTLNLTALKDTSWEKGSFSAKVSGSLATLLDLGKLLKKTSGQIDLKGFSFEPKDKFYRVEGLNIHLPFSANKKTRGSIALDKFLFRKLAAEIKPTPLEVSSLSQIVVSNPLIITSNLKPLRFDTMKISLPTPTTSLSLDTQASLEPTSLKEIFTALCVNQNWPASQVTLNFSHIELLEDALRTDGEILLNVLGGQAKLNSLKIFRVFSSVPETHLNFTWENMKLQEINNFVKFGKMEGDFEGYFKNVVFQSTLPTQFNFLFKVNPGKKGQVVFSSRAMKNFIQLFTPQDFQKYMTGPLNWFAFGWASDLIGGYNIDYAGLSLYSHQGSILLETLDPEAVVKNTKKHFILSGPRVKVPVQSRRYPIVLDAYGIANFLTHLRTQVDALNSEENNDTKNLETKNQSTKESLNVTDPCLNLK